MNEDVSEFKSLKAQEVVKRVLPAFVSSCRSKSVKCLGGHLGHTSKLQSDFSFRQIRHA